MFNKMLFNQILILVSELSYHQMVKTNFVNYKI